MAEYFDVLIMSRIVKFLVRTAMTVALILVCAAVTLGVFGLPKNLVRRLLRIDKLESSAELRLDWDRLRWSPWLGATLENPRLILGGARQGQVIRASRLRMSYLFSDKENDGHSWHVLLHDARTDSFDGTPGEAPLRGNLSALLSFDGQKVRVDNLMVRVPAERPEDRDNFLLGSSVYDIESGYWSGELFLSVDPMRYEALLADRTPDGLRYAEFNAPVQVSAEFGATAGHPDTLTVVGRVFAGNMRYCGEPITALDVKFDYEDRRWVLNRINLLRRDGFLSGWIDLDGMLKSVSLNVASTIPPDALARMVSPSAAARLSRFTLTPPVNLRLSGSARYGDTRELELNLKLRAGEVGFRRYSATDVTLEANISELGVDVYDFKGEFCGGEVTGDGLYEFPLSPFRPWFSADLSVRDIRLVQVAEEYTKADNPYDYEGTVAGRLALAGPSDSRRGKEWFGYGFLDIRDGYLLTLPLLGGLSRYLSVLYPRVGYAEQRNLECTFDILDSAVRSEDVVLSGNLLAIRGRGNYYFDGNLKFRVVVKLFETGGLLKRVAGLLILPISKALEFELSGTYKQPEWSPLNTPKRLLRFFGRTLGIDE